MSDPLPAEFTPNDEFLQAMVSMGINKDLAKIALYNTGNENVDAAIAFVFDEADDSYQNPLDVTVPLRTGASVSKDDRYKMVFVVNMELQMGVGKTASQVAHACLGLYRYISTCASEKNKDVDLGIEKWEEEGAKKIVLRGFNQQHLEKLQEEAHAIGLFSYIVEDAGHTEVAPGSNTVLSIFGTEGKVNMVTGELSLL